MAGTVKLSQLGASGAPAPAQSILLNVTQTSVSSGSITQAIPAGTYSVVSDYPCQLTINSVNYQILGGSTPTIITVASSATSYSVINLSLGLAFTTKTAPANLVFIAFGNGVFSALVSGASATSYTSPDGITWTARTMPSSQTWSAIIYAGSQFVALASGAAIAATSPDGITWTSRTLPSSTAWCAIAYNGTNYCAISSTSGTVAATSPDGVTWTARTLPTSQVWTGIAWLASAGVFVACSNAGTSWASSPDGVTWTTRTSAIAGLATTSYQPIVSGNSIFVAATSTLSTPVQTSTDGINWTARAIPASNGNFSGTSGLNFINGQFMFAASLVGANVGTTYYLVTSPDGINWTSRVITFAQFAVLSNTNATASSTNAVWVGGTTLLEAPLLPNPIGIYGQPVVTI